jgi:hypothetical protein
MPFIQGWSLSEDAARSINAIVGSFTREEPARDLVIASTLAFVELARKWDRLAGGRFQPYQLHAFLAAPPGWFTIDPVDEDLVEFFFRLPASVLMGSGRQESIEWTDAVHAATALSHDTPPMRCLLAVEDQRIRRIELVNEVCA